MTLRHTFRRLPRLRMAFALTAYSLAACSGGVGERGTQKSSAGEQTYTVSLTVTGLTGTGLVLQNNGGDTLVIPGNGTYTFPASVLQGGLFNVTVLTQPSATDGSLQTCHVAQGTGAISGGGITNIQVVCAPKTAGTVSLGGSVAGLTGTGLVLQNIDGTQLTVTANGPFTIEDGVAPGTAYAVSVVGQPSHPDETCSVANGAGTTTQADVGSLAVSCHAAAAGTGQAFTVGGTVNGLAGTGTSIQLTDNGHDPLTVLADGAFTFGLMVPDGGTYNVAQPSASGPQSVTCRVNNATGQISGANVANVEVDCQVNGAAQAGGGDNGGGDGGGGSGPVTSQTLTVKVTGLPSTLAGDVADDYALPLVIQDSDGHTLTLSADGTQSLGTRTPGTYTAGVEQQPGLERYIGDLPQTDVVCTTALQGDPASSASLQVNVQCLQNPSGFAHVINSADSTVSSYVIAADGSLMPIGTPTTTGKTPSAIAGVNLDHNDFEAGYLYVAAAASKTLSSYQLDPQTGLPLTDPAPVVSGPYAGAPSSLATDGGALFMNNTGVGASFTLFSLSGGNTFPPTQITDLGIDDGSFGASVIATPYVNGGLQTHAAVTPSCFPSPYVYVANSRSGEIEELATANADGNAELTPVTGFNGEADPVALAVVHFQGTSSVSPVVYVASGTGNTVGAYAVVCDTGALAAVADTVPMGAGLNSIATLHPQTGLASYLYATTSAGVVTHSLDAEGTNVPGQIGAAVGTAVPVGTAPGPVTTLSGPMYLAFANLTAGSTTVPLSTLAAPNGPIVPGMLVTGYDDTIPVGTTVTSVAADLSSITLSQAPAAGGQDYALKFQSFFVYAVDTTGNTITAMKADPLTGRLTVVGTPVPTGGSPAGIYVSTRPGTGPALN